MARAVWGIDIGHSSIKAVLLRRTRTGIELKDFEVLELPRSEQQLTLDERAYGPLTEMVARRQIGSDPVVLAVSGNVTFFRPFNIPPLPGRKEAEILNRIRLQARQQIPCPLEEVEWAEAHYPSETGDGETSVALVAIRKKDLQPLLNLADSAALNLRAVQTTPLALYNFARYELDPQEPVLVLDSGAQVTNFVIIAGDRFWFRPLPVAGEEITKVLEQKFRMSFNDAENLKVQMGRAKQAEKIFQVIEPTVRSLVGEVQRTLGFYKSQSREVRLGAVYVAGNTFKIPRLAHFLQEALGMEVRPIVGLSRLTVADGVEPERLQREMPGLAVAIGLALQGLEAAPLRLNFLSPDRRVKHMVRSRRPAAAIATAILVGSVFLSTVSHWWHRSRLREVHQNEVSKQLNENTENRTNLKGVKGDVGNALNTLKNWRKALAPDRGLEVWCLQGLLSLRDEEKNQPLFGPASHIQLTHLYISRRDPTRWMYQARAGAPGLGVEVSMEDRWIGDINRRTHELSGSRWVVMRVEFLSGKRTPPDVRMKGMLLGKLKKALRESGLIVGAKIVVHMKMPSRRRTEMRVVDGVSVKKPVGYAEAVLTMVCDFSKMRSRPR